MDIGNVMTLVALITGIGALIISFIKLPAQKRLDERNTSILDTNIVENYQKILKQQSEENTNLTKENLNKEQENKNLKKEIDELREEMIILDERHNSEIEEIKESFATERAENAKWRDYTARLIFQLKSWDLIPVPFNMEEAKKKGESLGEFGRITGFENLAPNSTKTTPNQKTEKLDNNHPHKNQNGENLDKK